VNLLRGQAQNENSELDFIDRSLRVPFDSDRAEYIRRGIRERIRQASVTICVVTDSTVHSKWVDWEIRESLRMGKGVVAMHPGAEKPSSVPRALIEHNIPIVPWHQSDLMVAIDLAASNRERQP